MEGAARRRQQQPRRDATVTSAVRYDAMANSTSNSGEDDDGAPPVRLRVGDQ